MNALAATATSTGEAVQFWVLGTVAVLGALGTILMKQAVHSALSLAGTMIVLAVFYLANGAYFLGVVQIIVYTGAIMMLFLFVVMLVGVTAADSLKETLKGQRWLAAACGLGFGVLLIAGIGNASLKHLQRPRPRPTARGGNVEGLAQLIFTKYVFAFEITGALLITAAVGAMVLTHRERTERAKTQPAASCAEAARSASTVASRHGCACRRCPRPASTPGTTRWTSPGCCRTARRPSSPSARRCGSAARSATCRAKRWTTSRRWSSARRSGCSAGTRTKSRDRDEEEATR